MAEYRALRRRHSMLDLCRTPGPGHRGDASAHPSLPARCRHHLLGPAAAARAARAALRLRQGRGPASRASDPLARPTSIGCSRFEPREKLGHVLEAIRLVKAELNGRVPLIGFAGAPFTLASYAIEGGHSTHYAHAKALMYGTPPRWHRLCERFADMAADYLVAQVEAGADAVQVFDSWVGACARPTTASSSCRTRRRIFDALRPTGVPDHPLRHRHGHAPRADGRGRRRRGGRRLANPAGRGVGEDWRGPRHPGQPRPDAAARPARTADGGRRDVLRRAAGRPGHIFNLGHGILPETPVEHVEALIEIVARGSSRAVKPAGRSPDGARHALVARRDARLPHARCAAGARRPTNSSPRCGELRRHRRPVAADRHHARAAQRAAARLGPTSPVLVGHAQLAPAHRRRAARRSPGSGVDRVLGDPARAAVLHAQRAEVRGRGASLPCRRASRSTAWTRFTPTRCCSRRSPSGSARPGCRARTRTSSSRRTRCPSG